MFCFEYLGAFLPYPAVLIGTELFRHGSVKEENNGKRKGLNKELRATEDQLETCKFKDFTLDS